MEYFNKIKDVVNSYVGTEAEQAVIECTSTEPWNSSNTLKKKICAYTQRGDTFQEVSDLIWKRLQTDPESGSIIIFKTLDLILFMLIHASQRFVNEIQHRRYMLSKWSNFQYHDGVKDYSTGIREKTKAILTLLDDSEELSTQRSNSGQTNPQYASVSNTSRYGGGGNTGGGYGGSNYGNNENYGNNNENYGNNNANQYHNAGNTGNIGNGSKYGGMGGGSAPPQRQQQSNQYSHGQSKYGGQGSHPQDRSINQSSSNPQQSSFADDAFTQTSTTTPSNPTTRRTIGQAAATTNTITGFQRPKQVQAKNDVKEIDPFDEESSAKVIVTQTNDDPFAAAANDFDSFTNDDRNGAGKAAEPVAQSVPVQAAEPAQPKGGNDDIFALLGSSTAITGGNQPQNSTDSLLSLYNTPQAQQQSNFGFQQPQQQGFQQPQGFPQQQQQQQQGFQQQYSFDTAFSPQQQQKQQSTSSDPFADMFAASSANKQQPQVPFGSSPAAVNNTPKKDDPFDFF